MVIPVIIVFIHEAPLYWSVRSLLSLSQDFLPLGSLALAVGLATAVAAGVALYFLTKKAERNETGGIADS